MSSDTPAKADSLIDNRYKPLRTLGEGAMGQVWLADDELGRRRVALKVVSTKLGATDKSRLQFKQEFRLMTQLRHPNCCQVYDYGETVDAQPYFTMEVVDGHGLDELVPVNEATFKKVFAQLMLALGYIHGLGLVHGDLKSSNVRMRPDGVVKLMDYGLMDYAGRAGGPIRGTPAYMAPEVIKRAPVDRRSDLYSAGCLAYELLTGVLPFGGARETVTTMQLLRLHVAEQPLPLEAYKPGIPPELGALIMKLLAKEPLQRFQSAFEVLEALGVEVPVGLGGTLLGSPLIGRSSALARLQTALSRLTSKTAVGGMLLVLGPAGIGKTRLLEEFRFTAQLEGVPCTGGDCFEQGNPPYGPFLTILRALAPALREQVAPELFAVHAPVLVKVLPELDPTRTILPAADLESPKNEMMRMHTAISHMMTALAYTRPYAMVLDNWQWADPLSRDLLDYMLRNLNEAPILVIVTAREAPEAARAIASAPMIDLAGLGAPELRHMVTSMLGTPLVDDGFLAKIAEFSEGNPFLVERLLEHLVQTQVLVSTAGRWNSDTALANYLLPLGLHAVLLRMFAALSPSALAIANLGAVLGRHFDLALLVNLTNFPEDELFDAIDQLQQSSVLQQDGAGAITFLQDQVPEMLYAQLEEAEKIRLHGAVAHALEARLQGPIAQAPLEQVMALARHWLSGQCDLEQTLLYVLEAAERNRRLYAMAEAERFAQAGIERLKTATSEVPQTLNLGFMVTLGDIKRQTGRAVEGRVLLEGAVLLADELGVWPIGQLLGSVGKTQQMGQDFDLALTTLARAVERCLAEGDPMGASRAYLSSARVNLFKGAPKLAIEHAEQGLALARESGDPTQLGSAHALIGYLVVAAAPERLEEGVRHLNRSLVLLEESGDQVGLSTSFQLLGNAQLILGDFKAALISFSQNKRITFEINSREEEAFACINLGIAENELGNFVGALRWAAEALEKIVQLNARFPLGIAMVVEAEALAYMGEEERARELAVESLAIAREIKHAYLESLVLGHQCELLLFLGRHAEARDAAMALEKLIADSGNVEPESRLKVALSELCLRAGDLNAAHAAAEWALASARTTQAKGIEVRALKAVARVAVAKGDFPGGLARATEALVLSRRIGTRFQSLELLQICGEAALALGNGEAGTHFDAMANLALELACPPLDAQARFGQAASRPYAGGAARAAEAKAIMETWLERMSPDGRASFPNNSERRRVLEGNYIGYSLPLRPRPTSGRDTRPLRLGSMGTHEI